MFNNLLINQKKGFAEVRNILMQQWYDAETTSGKLAQRRSPANLNIILCSAENITPISQKSIAI